jgi:hypothetical protein
LSGCDKTRCVALNTDDSAVKYNWIVSEWYSRSVLNVLEEDKCDRCGGAYYSGCTDKATCEAILVESGINAVWYADEFGVTGCGRCDKNSMGGCSKTACHALTLDGDAVPSWNVDRCESCSPTSMSRCGSDKCSSLTLDAGVTAACISTSSGGCGCQCYKCGKDVGEYQGCTTQATCEAVTSAGAAESASAWVASWSNGEQRCYRCSTDNIDSCRSKATCENLVDSAGNKSYHYEAEGETCSKCTAKEASGCSTKALCEALVTLRECRGDTCYDLTPTWNVKDNRCSITDIPLGTEAPTEAGTQAPTGAPSCTVANYWGCAESACNALEGTNEKFNFMHGSCQRCTVENRWGCAESACNALEGTNEKFNFMHGSCQRCDKNSLFSCATKANCEAIKLDETTDYNGNKVTPATTWHVTQERCSECGGQVYSGCISKATCEATQNSGGNGSWDARNWRCNLCGKDQLNSCGEAQCTTAKVQLDAQALKSGATLTWNPITGRCSKCGGGWAEGCLDEVSCTSTKLHEGNKAVWHNGRCGICGKNFF